MNESTQAMIPPLVTNKGMQKHFGWLFATIHQSAPAAVGRFYLPRFLVYIWKLW
jgi:hypothetical protein